MIIGTHNSCTFSNLQPCCFNILKPWTKNQSLSLSEQLELGIRVFDIRLSYSKYHNELYASHTFITCLSIRDIFDTFIKYISNNKSPLLFVNLRVDFHDINNSNIINSYLNVILNSFSSYFASQSDCAPSIKDNSIVNKILIYSSDVSIKHNNVIQLDLMPSVSFWNTNSLNDCEQRFKKLQSEFAKQNNNKFIFPNDKMIVFDYSSKKPLYFTDKQFLKLIIKYKKNIMKVNPNVIIGNNIQDFIELF